MNRGRLLLPLLAALVIVASGCGAGAHPTQGKPPIAQLQSIDQLRRAFDAHAGVPRLIVLVSPT